MSPVERSAAPLALRGPILKSSSSETFVDFLKADKSEVVIKSYSCELKSGELKFKGKLYVTNNYLCFVKLPEKKLQSIVHFYHIDSIILSESQPKFLRVTTVNKTLSFTLGGFRRPDAVASFVINYWSIIVRPRDSKVSIIRRIQMENNNLSTAAAATTSVSNKEKNGSGFFSSGRTTADDTASTSSAGTLSSSINSKQQPFEIGQATTSTPNDSILMVQNNSSLEQFSPVLPSSTSSELISLEKKVDAKSVKKTSFCHSTKRAVHNLLEFLRDFRGKNAELAKSPSATSLSFTMIIAYVIVIFLAISTVYVYHRMSEFPAVLMKLRQQQLALAAAQSSSNSRPLNLNAFEELYKKMQELTNLP